MMNVDQIYPPEMTDASNEMKKAYLVSAPDKHVELIDRMITWAEARLGHAKYAGWCLSFAEDALRTDEPERGAFVFYDCMCQSEDGLVNWGHCGISCRQGQIIHAWDVVREDDYHAIEAMTALTGDHPRYLGWIPVARVLRQSPVNEESPN